MGSGCRRAGNPLATLLVQGRQRPHRRPAHADVEGNPQVYLAALTAHSRYRTWQTTAHPVASRERLARLKLDRDDQKAQVGKHLKELARSDNRRIMALVAYAASGNLLDTLPQQLQDYLDLDLADLAEINWKRLHFPDLRDKLQQDLVAELKLQLQADPEEPVHTCCAGTHRASSVRASAPCSG